MTATAIVLCGGKSSRMGRPKPLLPWGDTTLIGQVIATARKVVDDVVVVSQPELVLPPLEARVVHDREPGLGPLAGIREGLEVSRPGLCFVVGTDMPFLSPDFISQLLSYGTAAAVERDGFVQTLAAVYPQERLAIACQLLEDNRRRPLFVLEAGGYRKVLPSELEDPEVLRNVNTPADYLAAYRESFGGKDEPVRVEPLGMAQRWVGTADMTVRPGTLGEIRAQLVQQVPELQGLFEQGACLFSLGGSQFVQDDQIFVAPGETLLILDAAVGG